jgi:2-polyprenyl-3-methyl-5-hydroxy-6-metoxy-1,4-benzoquinol methylase
MKCSICGSEKCYEKNGYLGYPLIHCNFCKSEFLKPQPTIDELNEIYSIDYYSSWGIMEHNLNETVAEIKKETGRRNLKRLAPFKTDGKLLDVGCALGYFLEVAKESGFDVYGVEISSFSSKIAQEKFGAAVVFNGILEQCPFQENEFDVITMFDLLEHTRNPLKVLKRAKSLLKNDGIISLTTPNASGLLKFMFGKRWIHYKAEHLYYFSKDGISKLADEAGLKVLSITNSRKTFNMEYVINQFKVYRHFIFSPLSALLKFLMPRGLRKLMFNLKIGEMNIILQNK